MCVLRYHCHGQDVDPVGVRTLASAIAKLKASNFYISPPGARSPPLHKCMSLYTYTSMQQLWKTVHIAQHNIQRVHDFTMMIDGLQRIDDYLSPVLKC